MNVKARIKLFLGLILVLLMSGGLVVYLNYSEARVGSNGASLQYNSVAVGTEYNGLITKQDVDLNDNVVKGEPLFELKSDVLSQEIANNQIKPSSLSYKVDPTNDALIFTAQRSGVVTQLNYTQGSFVSAGKTIAMISNTSDATISANFYLSSQEYDRLSPATPAVIHFPGGAASTATIEGVTQFSQNGHTVTTVKVTLTNLTPNQTIYDSNAPLSVDLVLNTNTLYSRINHVADAYTRSL
jgi:multidrug resistance efflux pump